MKNYQIILTLLLLLFLIGCTRDIRKEYWDNGNIKSSIEYEGQYKNGKAKYWHENGVLKEEEIYEQGLPVGYKEYYENGSIKSHFTEITYDTIETPDPLSEDISIDVGSIAKTIIVVKGLKEAVWKYWHENGVLKEEEIYEQGLPVGYKEYYENGSIKSHFTEITYDTIEVPDPLSEDIFVNVYRSKKGVEYYPTGSKAKTIIIAKGLKEGVWKYWDENKNLVKEETYKSDSLIEVRNY